MKRYTPHTLPCVTPDNYTEISNRAKEYARDYILDAKQYGYYTEENEFEIRFEKKFAELIIKECAEVASDEDSE